MTHGRRITGLCAVALCACALTASGCGGGEHATGGSATTSGWKPYIAPEVAAAGKRVFASARCGVCHALAAAGASGQAGPSLDEAKPSFDTTVEVVRNGRSGMPAFKGDLSTRQIEDVAHYVEAVAG